MTLAILSTFPSFIVSSLQLEDDVEKKKTRKRFFAVVALLLGLTGFVLQQVWGFATFRPLIEACYSRKVFNQTALVEEQNLHLFEARVGGPWVCFGTQFVYDLVQAYPAGLLTMGTAIVSVLPVHVLVTVEATRTGAKGIIRYLSPFLLLDYYFGEAMFPLLWVTGYILGRDDARGRVSPHAPKLAVSFILLTLSLAILVFWLDPSTYAWTLMAGLFVGPFRLLVQMLVSGWYNRRQEPSNKETTATTQQQLVQAYFIAGALAFVGWVFLLRTGWSHYGQNGSAALIDDLWTRAGTSVQFMVLDVVIVYGGVLTYLAYCQAETATNALFLTPLLGPGAAFAVAFIQLESERGGDVFVAKTKGE